MALLVKVSAAKANDVSSIPGTLMVEAENQLLPLGFLLLWRNTVTKINLGSKGFISPMLPHDNPSLKEDN